MSQFKWKVYYRTNSNGNVQTVEKEFDSQDEMNQYMQDHQDQFWSVQSWFLPSLFWGIDTYFNSLFDQRVWWSSQHSSLSYQDEEDREIEQYAKQREQKNKEREEKKNWFKQQMDKMKSYVDSFTEDNDDDKAMRDKAQKRHDYYKQQYESL